MASDRGRIRMIYGATCAECGDTLSFDGRQLVEAHVSIERALVQEGWTYQDGKGWVCRFCSKEKGDKNGA